MLTLFANLYRSMLLGTWAPYPSINDLINNSYTKGFLDALGTLVTSIFGDNQMTNFGTLIANNNDVGFVNIIALVLATITSIGIVVMAVKGIKKAFGIFFGQIR